jgi:Mn2+/Fe2+ NRAMP family transporter
MANIETSADAAKALRPIAGEFAFAAFALGIVGTGLLAVPVLAGSAAYALGETLGWRIGSTSGQAARRLSVGRLRARLSSARCSISRPLIQSRL